MQRGKLHTREIAWLVPGPLGEPLSCGPRPSGGDDWTPNVASVFFLKSLTDPRLLPSGHGPSWGMIVDWAAGRLKQCIPVAWTRIRPQPGTRMKLLPGGLDAPIR